MYLLTLPSCRAVCLCDVWGAVPPTGLHGPASSALTPSLSSLFQIQERGHARQLGVSVSTLFLSSFPWGLPSPTPGPRAPSPPPTCPALARSALSPGLPELGITLGTHALSGVCFCNLQSSCSPFSLQVVQGLVRGPASCLPTGWPPFLGLPFHLFCASWRLCWSLPQVLSGTSTRVMQPTDEASSHTVTQPSKLTWSLLFSGV